MPANGPSEFLLRNPDVILREEDPDGALLFNPDTNQIRVIDPTGLFIWKQCDGKKDLPSIVTALEKAFEGVPDKEVGIEVKAFVDDLRANGFLGVPMGTLNACGKKPSDKSEDARGANQEPDHVLYPAFAKKIDRSCRSREEALVEKLFPAAGRL